MKFTFAILETPNFEKKPFVVLLLKPNYSGYKTESDRPKSGNDSDFMNYVSCLPKFKDSKLCDFNHGNDVINFPFVLQLWHDQFCKACSRSDGFQKVGSFTPINKQTKIIETIEVDMQRWSYTLIADAWKKIDAILEARKNVIDYSI